MIKRTLYFGNPAHLSTKWEQLIIKYPDNEQQISVPIEDTGIVILDHAQITISHALIEKLMANNVAFITCDATHHPTGMLLNLDGHTLQCQKFQAQLQASKPLLKQLWQQTIIAKIQNQAGHLNLYGIEIGNMKRWAADVQSGDAGNKEARAAVYYWSKVFRSIPDFSRERFGDAPNHLLNYGYAILRAIVARSLIGSGLLPTLGIFHRNQYNAYCLADDIMEPYRPYVDRIVAQMVERGCHENKLDTGMKKELLQLPTLDVLIDGKTSPLMIAVQRTTASLAKCYEGKIRKIVYPEFR